DSRVAAGSKPCRRLMSSSDATVNCRRPMRWFSVRPGDGGRPLRFRRAEPPSIFPSTGSAGATGEIAMNPSLFVTGTDTGVGKPLIAAALLAAFARRGVKVVGMKPVASGSQTTTEGLRNEDALALIEHSNIAAPYRLVNPYCFEPAIAPHIAAAEAGVR